MGLTKQYLRYVPGPIFGVIGSPVNLVFVTYRNISTRYLATAACENVIIFDTKTKEKIIEFQGDKHEVTCITTKQGGDKIVVGYKNGSIKIFSIITRECVVTFSGHTSAVSCLSYDTDGGRLVSGGKDTEIVIWDVVKEAGLFRLKGHKGAITKCQFLESKNILISSSKDALLKFWDLDTQHCFKTVVGHRTEIWDFVLLNDKRIITGTNEDNLKVWDIIFSEDNEELSSCDLVGTIMKNKKDKVTFFVIDNFSTFLGCYGSSQFLQIYKFNSEEEIHEKLQKKRRKYRKSLKDDETSEYSVVIEKTLDDEISPLICIKVNGKIKGCSIVQGKINKALISVLLHNNSIELHSLTVQGNSVENKLLQIISTPGHCTDVRTVSFSSDNSSILSASGESLKIWNSLNQQCLCTMECSPALCSLFAPGDRHCIIGTKNGKIQIFDINAVECLETIDAHCSSVWSIDMASDQCSLVSGSADKDVKFWEFDLIKDPTYSETRKRLSLVHTRTLKFSDDVLGVKFSPDGKLLAVSLLDSTVKIFFVDTLKFFLSLFGHKYPVICMDISYDSSLIITGSADRNIKIWGLDFGDCHRSLFAHDDSIMCLKFLPKTHMFFSGSKDKMLKQWDADNFKKITTLQGHQSDIWAIAISTDGRKVVTSSHDKSMRLWCKTEEILVLQEEEEMEREEEYEKALVEESNKDTEEIDKESGLASKKTMETIKSTEQIIEALDIYFEEVSKYEIYKKECEIAGRELPQPAHHVLFTVYDVTNPNEFMLEVIKKIKSSELEEALLMLPFNYVEKFLHVLSELLEKGWEIELMCRCLFFLLRIHCNQIMKSEDLSSLIQKLQTATEKHVNSFRDIIGFNLQGLRFMTEDIIESEEISLFIDASRKYKKFRKKKKKIERAIAINKISI